VEILGLKCDLREDCDKMAAEVYKNLAIQLFAHAREAERSVDFVCMGPDQWALLKDYYGPGKQAALREIVDQLKPFIHPYSPLLDRKEFLKGSFSWLLRRPFIRMTNRTKKKWTFSGTEIAFIHQTFQCLIDILVLQPAPPALVLVNMRMDLYTCEHIIQRRLYGIPEIEIASRVEHFCQPDHIEHLKIEDLVENEKTSGPRNDLNPQDASGVINGNSTNRVA
jgi:hypothetical protein